MKKYLEDNKIEFSINLNNNNYYRGLEEINCKVKFDEKEIIIYNNHIYENNLNKKITFGFETKKLECIDNKINLIKDLLEKLDINTI